MTAATAPAAITLAQVIERFEPALRQRYGERLLPSHHQALTAMKRCRTRFAPRMLAACSACGEQRSVAHSCGHRACPHCQHHETQVWLDRQLRALVPASYFMVTFTLPAELRALAWGHQRAVYPLLMQCAWDTLSTFARNDPKLGATAGAVGVLHTHSRRLDFHPHVHMVMPAAALDAEQKLWRTKVRRTWRGPGKRGGKSSRTGGGKSSGKCGSKSGGKEGAKTAPAGGAGRRAAGGGGGYLFNHQALAKVFRGKLLDTLAAAGLTLPAAVPEAWVVDCKAVGDGQKALLYLSRYLYRGVIQERDILRCDTPGGGSGGDGSGDGNVTFQYRDAKTDKMARRTLPGADFLWLVLQHVLPKGLRRSRNFGFLHPNSAASIRLLQVLHLRPAPGASGPPTTPPTTPPLSTPPRPTWRCTCGQPMRVLCRRMPALQPEPADDPDGHAARDRRPVTKPEPPGATDTRHRPDEARVQTMP